MTEHNQITVPPSFIALFVPPGRTKPTASHETIAARHEFCEDLATLLTERAAARHAELGVDTDEILRRTHRGLLEGDAVTGPDEARWVVCRLAELLGWAWQHWALAPQGSGVGATTGQDTDPAPAEPPMPVDLGSVAGEEDPGAALDIDFRPAPGAGPSDRATTRSGGRKPS